MSGGFREKKQKRVSSSPNTCSKQQYTTSATETVHVPTTGFANMKFSDGSGSGDEFENHSQMNSDQKLDSILIKLNKMESKLDKLSRKVIQVESKVELNEAKIFDLNTRLDNMPTKKDYAKLEEKLDDQSNRLRRNNIVLHNVPEEFARYNWPHSFSCAARCGKRQISCHNKRYIQSRPRTGEVQTRHEY